MSAVDVLAEFRTMRKRFVNCATHNGSDKAFTEGACEGFDAALAAATELIEADEKAIDTLDCLIHAMSLPMPDELHMKALRAALPNLLAEKRAALARCCGGA